MNVDEWVIKARRRQGLPDHVEELSLLVELAALIVKQEEESNSLLSEGKGSKEVK